MPAHSKLSEASSPMRRTSGSGFIKTLRRAIQTLEGRHPILEDAAALLPFGIAAIDEALGGGLSRGALHEIAAAGEAEIAAATGFTLALAGRCASSRAVLWVAEDMALTESGVPYGPGLDEIGLAPDAVMIVTAARPRDVLWAMEEALRCRAVGAVIGEIRKPNAVDAVASHRLALAAARQQTPAFLLRAQPDLRPAAAATRWVVGAAASLPIRQSTGPPMLDVRLVRNRYGRLGSWVLEWNHAEQRFDLASAHPQPVAAAPINRPHQAARVA